MDARFHARGNLRRGVHRVLQVIFQVPAQIGAVLIGQREGKTRFGRLFQPIVVLEADFDPVVVFLFDVLFDA